jgi:signal transduction histidine kinase
LTAPLPLSRAADQARRSPVPLHSLRRVLLLVMAAGVALWIALTAVVTHFLLVDSFTAHELVDGDKQAQRLLAAMGQEMSRLDKLAKDWGLWNETYEFAQGGNPGFADDNIYAEALTNLDVGLVALVGADGKRRILLSVEPDAGRIREIPLEVEQFIAPGGAWLDAHRTDQALDGIVSTELGLLAFVARPIHRSDPDAPGPSAGTLVFARYLDDDFIAELREVTRSSLEIHAVDEPGIPADVARAAQQLTKLGTFVSPLDEANLGCYAALRDFWGQLVGVVRVVESRDAYALARRTANGLHVASLVIAALVGGMLYWFVNVRLVRRMKTLDDTLDALARGETEARVQELGFDDELTRIGQMLNRLVDELKVQQDAREARDAALTASRLKSDFLATLSQEIRLPLNAMLGALEVALEREVPAPVRSEVGTAYRAANSLVALLNDVLDFSKVNAGVVESVAEDFDLRALIEDVAMLFAPRANQHGLALNCFVDPKVARIYRGDQHRLRQVLANLVGNAIKFTLRGEITIRATLMGRRADEDSVVLSVIDTGIGFSPGQLSSFFDIGRGGDGARGQRQTSGLGLAVSKQLVTQLGGLFDVDSSLGNGSRISAALRMARVDEGSIGLFDLHAGRKALLLGDASGCRSVVGDYLASMGIQVAEAGSLAEAAPDAYDFAVQAAGDPAELPDTGTLPLIAVLPPGTPPTLLSSHRVNLTWPVQLHALQRAVDFVCTARDEAVPDLGIGI